MPAAVLAAPSPVATDLTVHRFSVALYDRLIRDGTFTDEDKVELLDGVIYDKMPHNAPHDFAMHHLHGLLYLLLTPVGRVVRCQTSVTFPTSIPEPDISVAIGPAARYAKVRPAASDLALVVEVSDTTLARDRGLKMQVYARARVPEYWVVNLIDRRVEVYTQPRGGKSPAYRARADYTPGDAVPVTLGGAAVGSIPVGELLP